MNFILLVILAVIGIIFIYISAYTFYTRKTRAVSATIIALNSDGICSDTDPTAVCDIKVSYVDRGYNSIYTISLENDNTRYTIGQKITIYIAENNSIQLKPNSLTLAYIFLILGILFLLSFIFLLFLLYWEYRKKRSNK